MGFWRKNFESVCYANLVVGGGKFSAKLYIKFRVIFWFCFCVEIQWHWLNSHCLSVFLSFIYLFVCLFDCLVWFVWFFSLLHFLFCILEKCQLNFCWASHHTPKNTRCICLCVCVCYCNVRLGQCLLELKMIDYNLILFCFRLSLVVVAVFFFFFFY